MRAVVAAFGHLMVGMVCVVRAGLGDEGVVVARVADPRYQIAL
jgi:hypothetical protein